GDCLCNPRPWPATQQDDGPTGRTEQFRLHLRQLAYLPDGSDISNQEGQRLLVAMFSLSKELNGLFAVRRAGQVIAAQPLDGADEAAPDCRRQVGEWVLNCDWPPLCVQQLHSRTADRASGWLSVEAAVVRVVVLGLASGTEGEGRKGRSLAVVRG